MEIGPKSLFPVFCCVTKYSALGPSLFMIECFTLNWIFLIENLEMLYSGRAKLVNSFLSALNDSSPKKSCNLNLTLLINDTKSTNITFSFSLMGFLRIIMFVNSSWLISFKFLYIPFLFFFHLRETHTVVYLT